MEFQQPSRTAQGAAMHRAAHQLIDRPAIFVDPIALTIVGEEAANELREGRGRHVEPDSSGLRAFVATRSRFTEDCLHEAIARGTRQYVILGAGLDTFAYREPPANLRVFEIDHPATQAWKRARLREAGIAPPDQVTYAPVDFEHETMRDGLTRAGFDFAAPAFFAWLGVTPYLTKDAIMNTLAIVASLAHGTEIVFDYADASGGGTAEQRRRFKAMADRVAASGEPFKSFFEPAALISALEAVGFSRIEDWDTKALNARYFKDRTDGLRLEGRAHLMHARA